METIQTRIWLILKAHVAAVFLLMASFQASAGVIYNSYAGFEIDAISITSAGGGGAGSGSGGGSGSGNAPNYEISLISNSTFDTLIATTGDGFAEYYTNIEPILSSDWTVGNTFYQDSESLGDAGFSSIASGTADSRAATDFSLLFVNNSNGNRAITFELLFTSFVSTYLELTGLFDPRDDGGAYAEVHLFDLAFPNNSLFFSSVELFIGGNLLNERYLESSFKFTLGAGESKTIYGSTYSEGYATAVPEPSVFWLLSAALMGLLAYRFARNKTHALGNYN